MRIREIPRRIEEFASWCSSWACLACLGFFSAQAGVPPFQADQPEGRRRATDLVLRDGGGPHEGAETSFLYPPYLRI
jgi:hypothetical protein